VFFFSSRRRHTRWPRDWSSDVCSSDLQLSRIIGILLAKAAEDRYQSAFGLKHDVDRCLREWATDRTISIFDLAQQDVSDRFLISQKLYGRHREMADLLRAFDATCEGGIALFLVSG